MSDTRSAPEEVQPGDPDLGVVPAESASAQGKRSSRIRQLLLPIAMRSSTLRQAVGIHAVYRATGGGLIASGLAYAALFAIIPTLVLVVAGLTLLVDDPTIRADAIDLVSEAFPALASVVGPAVEGAVRYAALGSILALIGFGWAASGLYLNLTRAMERFFPGERVSGVVARIAGVLLVLVVIVGVLAAVFVAGVLTVAARALGIDAEWLLAVVGAFVTLAVASGVTYGIYRVLPAAPPSQAGARLPALLVGVAIGLMTLLYGLFSPWLVSGFEMFGVMASVFVALVWLRLVFIAMTYGAAMARYRDHVALVRLEGASEPDAAATVDVLRTEEERAEMGEQAAGETGSTRRAR